MVYVCKVIEYSEIDGKDADLSATNGEDRHNCRDGREGSPTEPEKTDWK